MDTYDLELIAIGQRVTIGQDIPAVVTAIFLRGHHPNTSLSYEVAWWEGRNRREACVDVAEVRLVLPVIPPVIRIGFGASR